MTSRFRAIGLIAAATLAIGGLPTATTAAPQATTSACSVKLGSVTTGGDHRMQVMAATSPPTRTLESLMARDLYPDGQARLSGPMNSRADVAGHDVSGFVVAGSAMYSHYYVADEPSGEVRRSELVRVGGGWNTFTAIDESYISGRVTTYGLRADGVLFRWTVQYRDLWEHKTSYPGFAAVKSMALISQTATYDTFLANTRGGALYTIHIPTTSPMKPVVKLVRRTTWQVFESLVAEWCGPYGTLVIGIDKNGRAGYLYAVGHANGTATVIQSRGRVPVALNDPIYFHWTNDVDVVRPPFGE
ncbi:hypothetical protein [Kribbella koreensis]